MADILTVKRMLADRALSVAEMLLPNGMKEGPEWCAGSTGGEKGKSLKVHLTGNKAGIWQDFATGEGGDLLDLWCATRGMVLSDALDAARSYLGVTRPEPYRDPKPAYTRPPKPSCTTPKGRVLDYLHEDRNIPGEVLATYKVGAYADKIIFPFLLPNGELAMAKARDAADGASPKPTAANCEPVLFGWQAIPADARELIITEGEIDAMSWAAYGFPAMSVPFGGGKGAKQQWIENEYDRLERFEKIYISTDMDKPGEEAAEEISSRLGRHRCYRVSLPKKDANECLVEGIAKDAMGGFVRDAKPLDPEGLRRAGDFHDQVMRLFWPASEDHPGYSTPYGKLTGKLHFRPAEVTLWSGASGMGKSQVISDCVPWWIMQGSRVCLASFEMKCAMTLKRMYKQTGGVDRPTAAYGAQIVEYLDRGLLLYEKVGKCSVEKLLEIFDYARAKYGCDQFIIDSLMRLGIAGDDYTGQEQAVYKMVDWAVQNGVHLHLVAHARKGERGQGAPETEDIKGAMEIGANAFNILTIWRNRKHEEAIAAVKTEPERQDLEEQPGVVLNVAKQRNGDFEGKIGLWFDQTTYRYASSRDRSMWRKSYLEPIALDESEAA
jgi:twinkle protein